MRTEGPPVRCGTCHDCGYVECGCRDCTEGPGRVFLDRRHRPFPCPDCGADRGGAEPTAPDDALTVSSAEWPETSEGAAA